MRDAFVERLTELAVDDPSIMLLTGDLGFGVLDKFQQQLPRQFVNVGVSEQNMIGVAAGLASAGRKVFVYSIANFPTMRCLEQIRNDVAYHGLDVTVVAVGAGFGYGTLGFSHHATEDIAVMRAIPGVEVLSPADDAEARSATSWLVTNGGPAYLRLGKGGERLIHTTEPVLARGVPIRLRDGDDLLLLATGSIVGEAIAASDQLAAHDISASVYSVPFPATVGHELRTLIARHRCLITIEEHRVSGGFGSAVLEATAGEGLPSRVQMLGAAGPPTHRAYSAESLRRLAGLDTERIVSAAIGLVRHGNGGNEAR